MEKLKRAETMKTHNRHINENDEQVSAMQDALLRDATGPCLGFWGKSSLRLLSVAVYYIAGAVVFCNFEKKPCDEQPAPLVMRGVNATVDGTLCVDCTFVQEVEECTEYWSILDSIYFGTVTVTTVGYGDLSPASYTGRAFGFVFLIYGLGVVFTIISEFAQAAINRLEEKALTNMSVAGQHRNAKVVIRRFYAKSMLSIFVIALMVVFGGLMYAALEDWTVMEGVWWAFATTTTVGYGDLVVQNDSTKIFSIFFILVSVVIMALAIGQLSSVAFELAQEKKKQRLLSAKLNPEMIAAMDLNGDGVDRYEFVIGMLKLLDQLSEEQVAPWSARFDELDEDGSGLLDEDDLRKLGEQLEKMVQDPPGDANEDGPPAEHGRFAEGESHAAGPRDEAGVEMKGGEDAA